MMKWEKKKIVIFQKSKNPFIILSHLLTESEGKQAVLKV
jgi:hypothetical protein